MKVLKARLKLHWYLLTRGMWRGECAFEGTGQSGRVIYIAATVGSIRDDTITPVRVFLDEITPTHEPR